MAVPLPPGGTLQVTHFGEVEGFPWNVVHHFLCSPTTAPSQSDLDAITEAIRSKAVHMLTNTASSNLVFEGSRSKFWTGSGALYEGEALNPVLGLQGSTPSFLGAAVVVSWRVRSLWKGGKPRSYLAGIAEGSVSDGRTILTSDLNVLKTDVAFYLNGVRGLVSGALTCNYLTCLRRFADGGSEEKPKVYLNPPVHVEVVGGIVRPVLGSQRRRLHRL